MQQKLHTTFFFNNNVFLNITLLQSTKQQKQTHTDNNEQHETHCWGGGAAPSPRAPRPLFLMVGPPLLVDLATVRQQHHWQTQRLSAHRKDQDSNNSHHHHHQQQQQQQEAATIYVATGKSEDNEQKPMEEKTKNQEYVRQPMIRGNKRSIPKVKTKEHWGRCSKTKNPWKTQETGKHEGKLK